MDATESNNVVALGDDVCGIGIESGHSRNISSSETFDLSRESYSDENSCATQGGDFDGWQQYDYDLQNTGYEHMELGENFWDVYCETNEECRLTQWAVIGSREFNIPRHALNKLAISCKFFFSIVQWRLTKSKQLREKWMPKFAPALYRYLLKKSHPIKYTGCMTKTVPVTEELGVGPYGIRLLDTVQPIFSAEELELSRFAFANVIFRTHHRIPFVMMLFVASSAILSAEIQIDDYIDMGEEHGNNPATDPGRYLIDLQLPTKLNPIVLGSPLVNPNRLHFCIARGYSISHFGGGQVADIAFDLDFVMEVFTHAIILFKKVDEIAYDWSKFGMTFNGKINSHVRSTSLIRRLDDPNIEKNEETDNAEVLFDGFGGVPIMDADALAAIFNTLGLHYANETNNEEFNNEEFNNEEFNNGEFDSDYSTEIDNSEDF